tara:strand:- start:1137 stop:1343 length:207 start_codon:yes stop_codon:yes gene_type:complete
MSKKAQENIDLKYLECLEFLEGLLQKNCGNAKIGLADFSNNIENGWSDYQKRYLQVISDYRTQKHNKE